MPSTMRAAVEALGFAVEPNPPEGCTAYLNHTKDPWLLRIDETKPAWEIDQAIAYEFVHGDLFPEPDRTMATEAELIAWMRQLANALHTACATLGASNIAEFEMHKAHTITRWQNPDGTPGSERKGPLNRDTNRVWWRDYAATCGLMRDRSREGGGVLEFYGLPTT